MRIECEVEAAEIDDDSCRPVAGICITCGRCGHEVYIYGESGRRGLAMLREECPEDETNFYVVDEDNEAEG